MASGPFDTALCTSNGCIQHMQPHDLSPAPAVAITILGRPRKRCSRWARQHRTATARPVPCEPRTRLRSAPRHGFAMMWPHHTHSATGMLHCTRSGGPSRALAVPEVLVTASRVSVSGNTSGLKPVRWVLCRLPTCALVSSQGKGAAGLHTDSARRACRASAQGIRTPSNHREP